MGEDANAAMVRKVYDRWGEGEFGTGIEPYDDDTELVLRPPLPDSGSYRGPPGIWTYTRGLLSAWDQLTIEAVEIHQHGDRVLVHVVQRGLGTGSGVETEMRYFMLWTFAGEIAIRVESIHEETEAHLAAEA